MKLFRDLHYTRAERRRLAREDSAPGRRFPRKVGRRLPSVEMIFNRATIEALAERHIAGFRHREMEIRVPRQATVVITVRRPLAEIATFTEEVHRLRPVTLWVAVCSTEGGTS